MAEHPNRSLDLPKLGAALVAAAAVIYAIRTARREIVTLDAHCSNQETHGEVEYAVQMAARIISTATSRHAQYFEQKMEEFTTGVVSSDVPL